ncbi:MAG: tetratricopeptide repeat protein [Aureispira sp.]
MQNDNYPGDEVFDKIEALCDKGEDDLERGKPRAALKRFWKAFNLLPEPQTQYPAGTWLLLNIGDIYFEAGIYDKAVEQLTRALDCFEGKQNPFIYLRLGQAQYELENWDLARPALQQAWDLEGIAVYEDEDPKYLAFLQH